MPTQRPLPGNADDGRALHSPFSCETGNDAVANYGAHVPFFFARTGNPIALEGSYRGEHAFLIANGPSLLDVNLAPLKSRWCMTLNNGARTFRGNANCMVDGPDRFSLSMWLDPTITKFIPTAHFEQLLWDNRLLKYDTGEKQRWELSKLRAGDCPNVVGYRRNERFNADRWLWEETINWGNDEKHGEGRSVMFAALRILFLLGFRQVYLLGVDFLMSGKRKYHFPEARSIASIHGNISTFAKLQKQFALLQPHFLKAGFAVKNCNPQSRLTAFPSLSYQEALEASGASVGNFAAERTEGMYLAVEEKKQNAILPRGIGATTVNGSPRIAWLSPLQRRNKASANVNDSNRVHWLSPLQRRGHGQSKQERRFNSERMQRDAKTGNLSRHSSLDKDLNNNAAMAHVAKTNVTASLAPLRAHSARQLVAVIVTCHTGYLNRLEKAVASINLQSSPFHQKILVLDSVSSYVAPIWLNGWTVMHCNARNPNVGRNLGIEQIKDCEWVVHWDADNVMPVHFLADHLQSLTSSDRRVAFFYPSLSYVNDSGLQIRKLDVPEWDYWTFREKTFVDTSSLWNVHAVKSVGGWLSRQPSLDDWGLSLRLTRAGWVGHKSRATATLTLHPARRSQTSDHTEAIWSARSIGIITLWGGRSRISAKILKWYSTSELPPHVSLYWMDNSGDISFAKRLHRKAQQFMERFECVFLTDAGPPYKINQEAGYLEWGRHQHVANLYNRVLSKVSEDLVLFVEDDNLPPLEGLRKLSDAMPPWSNVAGVGGAYRSRTSPAQCCAALKKDLWSGCPPFDSLPERTIEVGMMGGGFTLYSNAALRRAVPLICNHSKISGALTGWDGNLGIALSSLGYKLLLHGGVKVEHHCKEVLNYLKKQRIINILA